MTQSQASKRVMVASVLLALSVACDAFTPAIDPTPYPCHDPRQHFCESPANARTCCWDWEACEQDPPRCVYVGPVGAARDAGRD